jgi:hypothetical protein
MGVMRARKIVVVVMMPATTARVRIAEDDFRSAVDRFEHEACRNERPQTEQHEDERRGPVTHATQP